MSNIDRSEKTDELLGKGHDNTENSYTFTDQGKSIVAECEHTQKSIILLHRICTENSELTLYISTKHAVATLEKFRIEHE